MYSCILVSNVDVWDDPNGQKIDILRRGTRVMGNAPAGEWVHIIVPFDCFTRKSLLVSSHYTLVSNPPTPPAPPQNPVMMRLAWDDELPEFDFRSRTADSAWHGPAYTPDVFRYYPEPRVKMGDFRVNISAWKDFIIGMNGRQAFDYWTADACAQFNKTGWPMFAYVGMSGNVFSGEKVGNWFRFETLKPSDLSRAQGMTHITHPQFIHRFAIVGWWKRGKVWETVRNTNTPRGAIFYPLITREGIAYIPWYLMRTP